MKPSENRWWLAIFLVLTALAYAGFFLSLSNPPFIDGPNHLARAVIMNSLWVDPHSPFQGKFSATHAFVPYMLSDVGLIFLLRTFGTNTAYRIWSMFTVLILVLGVWLYARQLLSARWAVAAAVLCSWYFATSYYLILGFFAFQWGLATAFIALAALEAWRANRKNSGWWIVIYWVACVACYGAHLATFAILAGLVGSIGLLRVLRKEQSWSRLVWECLPFAILAGYHVPMLPESPDAPADKVALVPFAGHLRTLVFGPVYLMGGLLQLLGAGMLAGLTWFKLGSFFTAMFLRQNYFLDTGILALFFAIIAGAIWCGRRQAKIQNFWQLAVICGLAALVYMVLPFWWEAIAYVDQRTLPFFFVALLMLSLRIFESSNPSRKRIALLMAACSLLAVLNLASLAAFMPRQSRLIAAYRSALITIPKGRVVLPVDARRRDGNTFPLRHAGSYYTVDRQGYTAYLFSKQTGSGPSEYFVDLSPVYRPPQRWYRSDADCDWGKVAESYDYVIVSKPWRASRIDLSYLEFYCENSAATVFRVRRATASATP
ncbi:MAG TPA: hypothetical protein VK752_26195 [Bryobacteraceae bacterium]|jgi:hypothetical protein|nr:hypothetical protein [Bryobacteraceae bacterium]